jgi:putative PIN family toxin of toxin-antitoxin system
MLALEHCVLCGSQQMIEELTEVLSRSYFTRRLPQTDRDRFLVIVGENLKKSRVSEIAVQSLNPPCRDGSDNFILALALAAQADAIVSSDHDLLALHPWNGIPILTPAQFVAQFPA